MLHSGRAAANGRLCRSRNGFRCVETFIPRMQAVRGPVIRLLMWEIGKTLPDACNEFDRTVDYVRANG